MRLATSVLSAAAILMAASPAVATDTDDALAVIRRFAVVANGTDREAYAAFCTADAVVIDHVPPYVFRGPNACRDEWDAVGSWTDKNKVAVSDYGKPSKPVFVDASGDRVYAVVPATASLTEGGKKIAERGVWTFVLRKQGQAWKVEAISWSTLRFEEVQPLPPPSAH